MSLTKAEAARKITVLTIAALAVLNIGIITPAHGQSAYEGMATQESVHVPDTRLRLFIEAQDAVDIVQDQYRQAAENPEMLQRSMGEEIIRTIEAFGLTVDEYNAILAEVQKADGETAKRYYDMIRTE